MEHAKLIAEIWTNAFDRLDKVTRQDISGLNAQYIIASWMYESDMILSYPEHELIGFDIVHTHTYTAQAEMNQQVFNQQVEIGVIFSTLDHTRSNVSAHKIVRTWIDQMFE